VQYASGSGQQSVTARPDGSEDQYWILHGAVGEECERGSAVAHGQTVRLQHANTRAWLHSHEHRSPLSGQNEVSCFGSDESSDTGDNWIVEIPSGAGAWERGKKVRFKHADTGAYLHSHGMKFGRPIAGHQEVCAAHSSGSNAMWVSAEGVYFPTPEEEAAKDEL
jgi:dolichyl-phosphate-mannose--protein O-mannosyl transferase